MWIELFKSIDICSLIYSIVVLLIKGVYNVIICTKHTLYYTIQHYITNSILFYYITVYLFSSISEVVFFS